MLGLEWSLDRNAEVIGLFLGKLRELDADFFQMKPRDFFIQFLRQDVNADFVSVAVLPEIELREHLI